MTPSRRCDPLPKDSDSDEDAQEPLQARMMHLPASDSEEDEKDMEMSAHEPNPLFYLESPLASPWTGSVAPGFWFVFMSRFVGYVVSPSERLPRRVDCGAGVLVLLGLAPAGHRGRSRGGGRLVRVCGLAQPIQVRSGTEGTRRQWAGGEGRRREGGSGGCG